MSYVLANSSTARPLCFLMIDSADHLTGKSGLAPTVTLSKNGAAFASPAGAVTEIANGWYKVAGNATDTNTSGPLLLHATATGADTTDMQYEVAGYNPDDAVRLGLTALPNAAANATGGLSANISHGGTAQAGATGSITLAAGASATTDFYKNNLVDVVGGTGGGQCRAITAYNGSTKVATVDHNWATAPDNTSVYAVRCDDSPSLDANLALAANAVNGNVTGSVGSVTGAVGSVTGNVGGNVVGSAGSVTGAVGSVTAAVTLSANDSPVVTTGTASAGAATTITLVAPASTTASLYVGAILRIVSGTGAGQTRVITAYTAGRVATVDRAWQVNPDATSVYAVYATDEPATDSSLQVAANAVNGNVTGSVASVTGAVGSVTGAVGSVTGNVGGNVVGSVGSVTGAVGSVTGSVGSVTGAVGSVTGNVGGNVVGSTASVTGAVGSVTGNVGGNVVGNVNGSVNSVTNSPVVTSGLAAAGAAQTITLATALGADAVVNAAIISLVAGTGVGQARTILGYVDSTKIVTVSRPWTVTPDTTSRYVITGADNIPTRLINTGTAQAGGATTITLVSTASATDNLYNETIVTIMGGTGVSQTRVIKSYVGATKVATVDRAWVTNPDNTSVYAVFLDNLPGTDGSGNLSGSVASVTGAVASVTGAVGSVTGNVGGNVVGSVGSVTGAVGSVTGNVGGNVTGSAGSVVGNVGGNVVGSVGSVTGNVSGNVTGSVGSVAAAGITAGSFAANALGAVWDELRSAHTTAGTFGQSLQIVRNGTAQAGAGTTVTLDAGASATTDFYKNDLVFLVGGTGSGQARFITAYNGGTKVATVSSAWAVNPDNTSVFVITPFDAIPGATAPTAVQNAQAVWDEARSSHTTAGSFGQGVASVQGNVTGSVGSVTGAVGSVTGSVGSVTGAVGSVTAAVTLSAGDSPVIVTGTASAGAAATITLAGASATDQLYRGETVKITGGAGSGQTRAITDYIGATKVATVDRAWATNPDNTSVFAVLAEDVAAVNASGQVTAASVQGNVTGSVGSVTGAVGSVTGAVGSMAAAGITASSFAANALGAVWDELLSGHTASGTFGQSLQIVRNGTAQAGAGTTVTLDAGASATTDFYKNDLVFLVGGTGSGQARFITAYNGGTKVATVSSAWAVNPDNTSVFVILPFDSIPGATAPTASQNAQAVWDEARAAHVTAGSFGQGVVVQTDNDKPWRFP